MSSLPAAEHARACLVGLFEMGWTASAVRQAQGHEGHVLTSLSVA